MRRRSLAALALGVLLLTAGCSSLVDSPDDDGPPETTARTAVTTDAPGATDTPAATLTETTDATDASTATNRPSTTAATPTPTRTATATDSETDAETDDQSPSRATPWGDDPIVVGVAGDSSEEYAPLVRDAAAFWEENDRRYLGGEVRFEIRPDAADPDVRVNFSERVPECGGVSDAAGCAPHITDRDQIRRPVPVWVMTGLSDDSTTHVLEHELGHVLGLGHDDRPGDVMRAESVLYTRPRTNVTDRALPWDDSEFTVYADVSAADDPDAAREQVDHALAYYEAGAPGMPDNLTFRYVDDPEAADVAVEFADEDACDDGAVSCVETRGTDPDGDGAMETYTSVGVTLAGVSTDAAGWHVGYWLAYALGAEDDGEKPPPFRDTTYRERRDKWWE